MSLDQTRLNPLILSAFSRRRLDLISTDENMNDFIELFDHFQQRLVDKQKLFEIQRDDIHQSINQTFNKIFEQLIEIRRFCRNDIEQQTLNAQVCLVCIRLERFNFQISIVGVCPIMEVGIRCSSSDM
jgi:hypothetical protein